MLEPLQNLVLGTRITPPPAQAAEGCLEEPPSTDRPLLATATGPSVAPPRRRRVRPRLALGSLLVLATLGGPAAAHGQPIPVELAVGNRYATTNLVVSKPFAEGSRLGYFHLSTIGILYEDTKSNDLAIQNLLFYELVDGLRVTGGGFHTERGFSPTVGMQYVRAGRDLFLLVAPRVNIDDEPSYSVFSIVRYKPRLTESTRLYLGAQLLNTFDATRHIKSYQWVRVGLEIKGTQFGLALNFDENGPHPTVQYNVGVFVRREIF